MQHGGRECKGRTAGAVLPRAGSLPYARRRPFCKRFVTTADPRRRPKVFSRRPATAAQVRRTKTGLPRLSLVAALACALWPCASAAARSDAAGRNAAARRDALMREAEAGRYSVRRVEFVGNRRTRDNVLRRRLAFDEGDLFTKELLLQSLRQLSGLKVVRPVGLEDVEVRLDRAGRSVDLSIRLRETTREPPARPTQVASSQSLFVNSKMTGVRLVSLRCRRLIFTADAA